MKPGNSPSSKKGLLLVAAAVPIVVIALFRRWHSADGWRALNWVELGAVATLAVAILLSIVEIWSPALRKLTQAPIPPLANFALIVLVAAWIVWSLFIQGG